MESSKIEISLLKLNLFPYLKGFSLVKRAIKVLSEEENAKFVVLYYELGKEENISAAAVERRIRFVIQKSYPYMDKELKRTLFHDKEKVTNAEFLSVVACAIKNDLI